VLDQVKRAAGASRPCQAGRTAWRHRGRIDCGERSTIS
jgi:hypothetical protein